MAERIILSPKIKCAGWKKRTGLWNQGVIRPSMDRGIISRRKMDKGDFVLISTLEGFEKISRFYGANKVVPLYIEVDDMTRIERSLKREKEQKNPCVSEVCRRFLADEKDFSKENLKRLNITDKIVNDSVENALREIVLRIKSGR